MPKRLTRDLSTWQRSLGVDPGDAREGLVLADTLQPVVELEYETHTRVGIQGCVVPAGGATSHSGVKITGGAGGCWAYFYAPNTAALLAMAPTPSGVASALTFAAPFALPTGGLATSDAQLMRAVSAGGYFDTGVFVPQTMGLVASAVTGTLIPQRGIWLAQGVALFIWHGTVNTQLTVYLYAEESADPPAA